MKRIDTALPGVCILEPRVHGDARGFFVETWNERTLAGVGITTRWVQDNHSRSARGVLRGMHWQVGPNAQDKLVRCPLGRVFDVAADLRAGSPTFGKWVGVELSEDNHRQLLVPRGFAHGFLVLSERADFCYKVSAFYDPAGERGFRFDDPAVGIAWPDCGAPHALSGKDAALPAFAGLGPGDLF